MRPRKQGREENRMILLLLTIISTMFIILTVSWKKRITKNSTAPGWGTAKKKNKGPRVFVHVLPAALMVGPSLAPVRIMPSTGLLPSRQNRWYRFGLSVNSVS